MIWFLLIYSIVFGVVGWFMAPTNEWWLIPLYSAVIFFGCLGVYFLIG